MDTDTKSLNLHASLRGKLSVETKTPIESFEDLSLVYTPGVATVCRKITDDPAAVYDLSIKSDTVAVVTNGTAVLGLGNVGTAAAEAPAALVDNPSPDRIVPGVFDPGVAAAVALAVKSNIR